MNIDVEIDMAEFSEDELLEELNRRMNAGLLKGQLTMESEGFNLPFENLDFRLKLELFVESWERIPFTDLRDRLR